MSKIYFETDSTIGEIVRKAERDYTSGTTTISKYVEFSMHETLEKVDAYLNSKFIKGQKDSKGRVKPFFNIVVAAANIWYRATDIDRKHIKIKATKAGDMVKSFIATVHLQDWMKREKFGAFLNEWGRVLARYGSAVVKFVDNDEGLHPMVIPWNRLIVDAVDFDNNVKIEIIELTEAQLRQRKGYDKEVVDSLCNSRQERKTTDGKKKDTKSDYIKLYEIHGQLPLSRITKKESDEDTYVQQMHVISFLAQKKDSKKNDDFTLYSGREEKDPYMITHLIKEDGRTLSIGAVEHLFEAQFNVNHSMKSIKDMLEQASKIIYQTADPTYAARNALTDIENGDILVHAPNAALTQINNGSHDVVQMQNYAVQWKSLGNEITGISEAMLGAAPKSGTAWRQTEALLQENYSLFMLMTQNKGLYLEDMLREFVIPHLKTKMDTKDEVMATLEGYDLEKIDKMYITGTATKKVNAVAKQKFFDVLKNKKGAALMTPEEQVMMLDSESMSLQNSLSSMGNVRSFSPSEMNDLSWKKYFKDFEWDAEVDITGESFNVAEALTTLNTAMKMVLMPGFDQNKKAQLLFSKALELTGTLSPLELSSIPSTIAPTIPQPTGGGGSSVGVDGLQNNK